MNEVPKKSFSVILTGATGFVGEGVLLTCLEHPAVTRVLSVSRKPYGLTHPKLEELIVTDFLQLDALAARAASYDACFYCAGISSQGMTEADYTRITYDIPVHFAETLLKANPGLAFEHISGAHADSSEKGRVMWARVKGRTENALLRLPFRQVHNFRPGLMRPRPEQRYVKTLYKVLSSLYPVLSAVFPRNASTMQEVGLALIQSVLQGYPQPVLEVTDIKTLAAAGADVSRFATAS